MMCPEMEFFADESSMVELSSEAHLLKIGYRCDAKAKTLDTRNLRFYLIVQTSK